MRHHCLLHGPDATSSTQGSSVLFLNAWTCPFRVMKPCQAARILSPRGQINLPTVSKCEGCLVVRSGHGPQAEVAQGVGPGPLVEL